MSKMKNPKVATHSNMLQRMAHTHRYTHANLDEYKYCTSPRILKVSNVSIFLMSHNFLAPWSSCPGTEVGLCPAKAREWSERLVGTKNIGDFSILSTFSSRFGTYFLLFQQRSTELINGLAYVGGWTWSTNGSVVGVGGSCGKKKASDKQAWVIYVISYQSTIPKWRTQTTCPSLLERGCQQVWGTTSLHCLDEVIAHLASTGPRPFLTCTSRISRARHFDRLTLGAWSCFGRTQICKSARLCLCIIPPNWCRHRSSIEDCSLIWCDSIVRSSKKATPPNDICRVFGPCPRM